MSSKSIEKSNPYDYMRPVSELHLFAGRSVELEIIREEISKLRGSPGIPPIIALSGERRVGKTSILYRVEEIGSGINILSTRISLTQSIINSPWEFWQVLFETVHATLGNSGINLNESQPSVGFKKVGEGDTQEYSIQFPTYYANQRLKYTTLPPSVIINDFRIISDNIAMKGYSGLLIILDEAQLLVDLNEIQQQLRDLVTQVNKLGIVFAGEPSIGKMFYDDSNRFYHQGRVIQVNNFTNIDDVADCAIKPLSKEERILMSPMTIDYLLRLSQGKPNQIRLICSSIYSNYMNGKQDDLNININTLYDVIEIVSSIYTDYDLKQQVDKISSLSSVDLEILYRITRYPNWDNEKIIDLEESFRGETRSELAIERRRKALNEKRSKYISDGILKDIDDRCVLAGDEFTYLYVRFLYEIRKFGDLSRRLELGKGAVTPFSEKVDKLVRSLTFELGRYPRIRFFANYPFNINKDEIRAKVRRRFKLLENLILGEELYEQDIEKEEILEIISECSQICELVKETGSHHFVSILVRNAQDVNEITHVELYFDPVPIITLISPEVESLLKKQAELANVWLEDIDDFKVAHLPNLPDLLEIIGVPSLEELLKEVDEVIEWRVNSVRHIVASLESSNDSIESTESDEKSSKDDSLEESWLRRYDSADEKGAIEILNEKIAECTDSKDNPKLARYYNDLGYIKSTPRIKMLDEAIKDLERAIAYHYWNLELSLLNLGVIYIDKQEYPIAQKYIEDALFIASSRENIMTGYLKLRLPTHSSTPIGKMEQRPANVIEASYINLAYIFIETDSPSKSLDTIREGLELFPSSYRLKHAQARIYLSQNQAVSADEIYDELSRVDIRDSILSREINEYVKRFLARKRRRFRRRR